jgi:plastocyanin
MLSGQVAAGHAAEIRLHLVSSLPGKHHNVPAVVWLEPMAGTPAAPFPPTGHYTLLQKNRTFSPHLQVIPIGSTVQFPNDDPFFHNVFSLYNGKRFDLGLYEAGSSRSVSFSKPGVSYIFCNIHPEMSAVIISLTTPLYAIADAKDAFVLNNIPPGDYKMNLWAEGVPQSVLDGLSRKLHLTTDTVDLGELRVPIGESSTQNHLNKFGHTYDSEVKPSY